ncbi:MAG: AI-2E family transporter [Deltaproteobacteria bacterium]|nr:AI-2E family transporter [Deltaproteobacteria bacterium]
MNEFARVNRVIIIWTVFFYLLYVMRAMFGLIFITFIMCFVAHSLSRGLYRLTKLPRKVLVVIIYLLFFSMVGVFVRFAFPKILEEAKHFMGALPENVGTFNGYLDKWSLDYPYLKTGFDRLKEAMSQESLANLWLKFGRTTLEVTWKYLSWFFIAMLFSFLIMLDLPDLIQKFRRLRYTKLQVIYEATTSNVIKFAQVVCENFRAQIFISAINTCLTFVGLSVIGTGTTALLSIIVFCCGLVPVLGVLMSSVPIALVAMNVGGQTMLAQVVGLIVTVHAVEAYVLNPRIVSAVMKLNPVITLMILYIAHSLMGLWGMLLGVPISVFFFSQISLKGQAAIGSHNGEASGQALKVEGAGPERANPPKGREDGLGA